MFQGKESTIWKHLHNNQKSIEIFSADKIKKRKNFSHAEYNNIIEISKMIEGKRMIIIILVYQQSQRTGSTIVFHEYSLVSLIFTDFDENKGRGDEMTKRKPKKRKKKKILSSSQRERERERKGCIATIFPSCFSRSSCTTTAPFAPLFLYKRGKEAVVLPPR